MMLKNQLRSASAKRVGSNGCAFLRSPCSSGTRLPPQLTNKQHMIRHSFAYSSTRNVPTVKYTSIYPFTTFEQDTAGSRNRSATNYSRTKKEFFSSTTSTSESTDEPSLLPPRDVMMYDVCIVGGGPAGLAAAIKIKQLCQQYSKQKQISVCVIDKGRYGGHG
jgi:hypothetical protein